MTAAEIRAAADRLDALASAATPGPWIWRPGFSETGAIHTYSDLVRRFDPHMHPSNVLKTTEDWEPSQADAAYIAAMHPAVAKALAAWLRAEADAHIHHDDGEPLSVWDLPGMDQHPALAVARALSPP